MKYSGFTNHEENIQKSKTMKIEKLKIANEINAKIKDLNDHKKEAMFRISQSGKIDIRLIGDSYNYTTKLRQELLPVTLESLIESYYASIDAEIKRLEIKLEML
jgi:hypothetical protein